MPPEHDKEFPPKQGWKTSTVDSESSAQVQKSPWGFILKVLAGIIVTGSAAFGFVMRSNNGTLKETIVYERARAERAESELAKTRQQNDDFKDELLIKNNIITDYRTADSVTQYLRKKTVEPTRKILSDAKR